MTSTECKQSKLEFQEIRSRKIEGNFDGGMVTSDAGALLVREVSERLGILSKFAACFEDHRKPEAIEFSVTELVSQRVYGLVCGYSDLNDHDRLRVDPLMAVLAGKEDVTGAKREKVRDQGKPLAGRNTLNRLELSEREIHHGERYKKIACSEANVENYFIEMFLSTYKKAPKRIIIDCDATDVPLYGNQEDRFYHGYYQNYCYLPLMMYCEDIPLVAKLRPSNIDASAGTAQELARVIPIIRARFPKVRIIIRGDSGFAREEIMRFCEENDVDYLFGLAQNNRLNKKIAGDLRRAEQQFAQTHKAARYFKEFRYRTKDSWSRSRRVIGKAEHLAKGSNPRFVVTSLKRKAVRAVTLYEQLYCARGDMENRIKEQLSLFADRMSAGVKRANQVRLWLSTVAYLLMVLVRRHLLKHTALAHAQVQTIRERLLKIGAVITVSVRRVYFSMASAFPLQEIFRAAWAQAQRL